MTATQGEGREVAPLRHLGNLGIYDHMNEKAKKVLSYVACAIGGACLGIALLGGLSYCSTSSAREKADTINTIDRVKHNTQGTTANGYTKFTFEISSTEHILENNQYHLRTYNVDTSNYNLTLTTTSYEYGLEDGYSNVTALIHECQNNYTPSNSNALNLLVLEGCNKPRSDTSFYSWTYISFLGKSNPLLKTIPFILLTNTNKYKWSIDSWAESAWYVQPNYVLNYGPNQICMGSENPLPNGTRLTFQDVESYYKELGYQDGYSAGETAGNSAGYSSGYEAGSSAGYESGYDQGFQEGYMNTYYAFTSLIVNRNAIWNMANIPWHSDNDIYVEPGHLSDYPFLDPAKLQTNTYVNWAYLALFRDTATLIPYWIYAQRYTTSQNNGYVSFVIRISPADQTSTDNAGNIGSYSGGVSLSETSIFQTETVTEWTAQNRCQLIAFGSEDPRDIYRDWFDNGYILPRGIAVDENAYEQGYKQGQLDAQRNTSMNNVFALFTPAFGAVASFFDMKIFGFLPLYWFLIAPLFIALISLIMRMVKH